MVNRTCSVPGCDRPHSGHGYCKAHNQRMQVHGDVRADIPIADRAPGAHHRRRAARYPLNETYFDAIDTPEKAYWLGFIVADGGIVRQGTKSYDLRVELAEVDAGHLRLLGAVLESPRQLLPRIRKRGNGILQRTFTFVASSWYLVESLERLGVTTAKSATAVPWAGPASLMPHYWRGLFDGDGGISYLKTNQHWSLSFCGSRPCVQGFSQWAAEVTGIHVAPLPVKHSPSCWTWVAAGTWGVQRLAVELYGNAPVGLERKLAQVRPLLEADFEARRLAANEKRREAMKKVWAERRQRT